MSLTNLAREIEGNLKRVCGREKDSQILLEPMRQGRVFSPSATTIERKYTSRTPQLKDELLRSRQYEHSTCTWCLVVAFNEKVYREGSSNRRPKAPDGGNNKNAKKTQTNTKEIFVCEHKPR